MRTVRSFLICGVASVLMAGCATRPLPSGTLTRNATYSIAQSIRCETRNALKAQLTSTDEYGEYAIAFGFALTVTEDNDNTGEFTLKDPITNGGIFSLIFKSGVEIQRENKRRFGISDKFKDLYEIDDKDCDFSTRTNILYPTTGAIGMAEMIRTFIALRRAGGLAEKLGDSNAAFIDTLTFKTRIYGTADPKIELTPMTNSLHLAAGNSHHMAERNDHHVLTLAISYPDKAPPTPGQGELSFAEDPERAVSDEPSTAETDALRAVADEQRRERSIEFFDTQQQIRDFLEQQQ